MSLSTRARGVAQLCVGSRTGRLAVAVVAVVAATGAAAGLRAWTGAVAFEPLVGAVVLVALLAGPGAAVVAAVLSAVAAVFFVIAPVLTADLGDAPVRAEWITSLAVMPLVIALAYVVRRARDTALRRVAERDALRREERLARERAAFLAEASARLVRTLELEPTLAEVGHLAVPGLADWISVDVLEDGRLRTLAVAHSDPALEQRLRDVATRGSKDLATLPIARAVIESGRPLLHRALTDALIAEMSEDAEEVAIGLELRMRSLIGVPLKAHDTVLGLLSLVRGESGAPYTRDDLALAEELGSRLAAALENASLHAAERAAHARADLLRRIMALGVRGGSTGEVAGAILDEAMAFIGAAAGFVQVLDDRREQVRTAASRGYPDDLAAAYAEVSLGEDIIGNRVIRSAEPYFVDGWVENDRSGGVRHFPGEEESHAILPLVSDGETIGSIGFSFESVRRLDTDQRDLLRAIADQCSQVIRRALIEESRQRLARQVLTLHEISELALRAGSLLEFLESAVGPLATLIDSDSASILLLDPQAQALVLTASVGLEDNAADRVVIPLGQGFGGRVALSRQPLVIEDMDGFPVLTESMRKRVRAIIGYPLIARGQLVGVMHVGFRRPRRFSRQEVAIVGLAAERLAVAVQHAQDVQRERQIAETLQRSLLPQELPAPPGWQLAGSYEPGSAEAQIGGDWYDAYELDGRRLAIVIGDVAGKGIDAAALMGQLRNAIRAYAVSDPDPSRLFQRMSALMTSTRAVMATCFYGVLDTASGELRYASAGHPPAAVLRADGAVEWLRDGRTVPLGVATPPLVVPGTARLRSGDLLALYTDGLVERRGEPLQVGLDRLLAALPGLDEKLGAAAGRIQGEVVPAGAVADDRALLLLRRVVVRPVRLAIGRPEDSLVPFRNRLRAFLREAGVGHDDEQRIVLTAGEALANAVGHGAKGPGRGAIEVDLAAADGEVHVTVAGPGAFSERGPTPLRGRGIPIMRHFAHEVRIERGGERTTVHLVHRIGNRGGNGR